MVMAKVSWTWVEATASITPMAAVATGARIPALLRCLQTMPETGMSTWQIAFAEELLIVIAPSAVLPWLDGLHYAANSHDAPTLWLPTHLQPSVAPELLARAFKQQHQCQPLLLWPNPAIVVPLDTLLPMTPCLGQRLHQLWLNKGGVV